MKHALILIFTAINCLLYISRCSNQNIESEKLALLQRGCSQLASLIGGGAGIELMFFEDRPSECYLTYGDAGTYVIGTLDNVDGAIAGVKAEKYIHKYPELLACRDLYVKENKGKFDDRDVLNSNAIHECIGKLGLDL